MFKQPNIGNVDRLIRLTAGIALIVAPYVLHHAWLAGPIGHWGALVVGAVLVITALVRFCPAYALFGMRTCSRTG